MSIWRKLLGRSGGQGDALLLTRRIVRFRQLLGSYAAFLDLLEDAAEKQGGDYVLDRQYVIALADKAAEVADAAVFDLNVLTSQRDLDSYDALAAARARARSALAAGDDTGPADRPIETHDADPVGPGTLAAALARHPIAYRRGGQVTCRGVAAGRVYNLASGHAADAMPAGSVLVARTIVPDDTLLATLRRAAALLLDEGHPTSPAASLARELRIPAITGLGDVTRRLDPDTPVTVDADENTVYIGVVRELLDYYAAERIGSEEEPEYRLLRAVRRQLFPLTLGDGPLPAGAAGCPTLHDLVFRAQALAAEALTVTLSTHIPRPAPQPDEGAGGGAASVVDLLGDPTERAEILRNRGGGDTGSRPLAAFLAGLSREVVQGTGSALESVGAAVKEEQASILVRHASGEDLVDAVSDEAARLNHIYCRLAPHLDATARDGRRGVIAAAVLARYGFTVWSTGDRISGLIRALPPVETAQRLGILGRLLARLGETPRRDLAEHPLEAHVEELVRECGQVRT
ncbi:MAG: PEP-utilizing enzyme [Acidobacteriota bacterium]